MNPAGVGRPPFSLDPTLDRERFEELGRKVLSLAADWFDHEADAPILPHATGDAVHAALGEEIPRRARPWNEVQQRIRQDLFPHCRHNGHPGFLAYVSASAEPIGALGDLLASSLNQNVTAWRSAPAAATLERQVVAWLDQAIGFDGGHGILVGGGSAANLHGLCLALERGAETTGRGRESMVVYVSDQTHLSIAKGARILGVPADNVRVLPSDATQRMDPAALRSAVEADRRQGSSPVCVVASAGTVNTGAIDPLEEIASVAAQEDLWLHVDGAYGAPAAMTDDHAWLRPGFAKADSLSLNPHKWLYASLDVGCLLTRHPRLSHRVFSADADYVHVDQSGDLEGFAFFDHGLELSRRFRALKLWVMFQLIGFDRIAARIREDVAIRRHLDERIASEPLLRALGSGLSICCFAHRAPATVDADALNRAILDRLNGSGRFLLSPTTVHGDFALRVCIVNFRTRPADMDDLLDAVLEAGASVD